MVFNIISLKTYAPTIFPDDIPDSNEVCEDLWSCVQTVYWSGAVGDEMDDFQFFRFAFDLLYIVFMELLMMNLIGGVMIDTFSSLRSADDSMAEDKKNRCYICNKVKEKVVIVIFRLRETVGKIWKYISRSTGCGTMCTTSIVWRIRMRLITVAWSMRSRVRWRAMILLGSQQ